MEVKQGSHQPVFGIQILGSDGKTPVNLTSMTSAVFRMRPANGTALTVTDQPMTVANASLGELFYQWQDGNTATPGRYLAQVQCTFPTGILTVPYEYNRILIAQNLQPIGGLDLLASTFVRIVEDFGADPTGVGDSTSAFQSAIAYLNTAPSGVAGGVIFVATGTYRVNLTIASAAGITFLASGQVGLVSADNVSDTVYLSGTTNNCVFSGFWVVIGPSSGTGACVHMNVGFNHMGIAFDYLQAQGGYNGIVVDACISARFARLEVDSPRSDGVLLTGLGGGNQVNNVWIHNYVTNCPGQTAFRALQGSSVRIDQADVEGCGAGFVFSPSGSNQTTFFSLNHVYINGMTSGNGITIGGGPANSTSLVSLHNIDSVNATVGSGIVISSSALWIGLNDVKCLGNAAHGIVVNGAITDLVASNCICNGNHNVGFYINGAAQRFALNSVIAQGNTNQGIYVPAVAADNYTIQGCIAYGNGVTPGVLDQGTGTHKSVTSNVSY